MIRNRTVNITITTSEGRHVMPTAAQGASERTPILPASTQRPAPRRKRWVITILAPVVLVWATIGVLLFGKTEPKDPLEKAKYYLNT